MKNDKYKKNTVVEKSNAPLDRKIFIVRANDLLIKHLINVTNAEFAEAFKEIVVVMTDLVDFEKYLEGRHRTLLSAVKKTYMKDLYGEYCLFENRKNMCEILGDGTNIELFDKWFLAEIVVNYLVIRTELYM